MENYLTNNSKSTNYCITSKTKTQTQIQTKTSNKFIADQYELVSECILDLDNAVLDIELDNSFDSDDDSDKLQACHQTAFTINYPNYIIKKRSSKRLIPNKFLHQITYKINNNDNYNNGNDNKNGSNNNNNNNNQNINNYNRNDNKNNNIFNNIKTENQRKLCSRYNSKINMMNSLSIQKRKNSLKIFNLIITGTILY